MTLGQLKDAVSYESKVQDIDAFGGWLELTLLEIFENYTALTRYQQLYVPNYTITATAATATLVLPANLQHIDLDSVIFRQNSDYLNDVSLFYTNDTISAPNSGNTAFVLQQSTSVNGKILTVFPYADLTINDQFIINYWKKVSFDAGDDTVLIPDEIIPTIKMELTARANLFGDGKQFAVFRSLAKEQHSRSMGVTSLPGANG